MNRGQTLKAVLFFGIGLGFAAPSWSLFPDRFKEEEPEILKKWNSFCQEFPKEEFVSGLPTRSRYHYVTQKKSGLLLGWARAQFVNTSIDELVERVLDYKDYPKWILPEINLKEPDGGRYFVTLDGLDVRVDPKIKEKAVFTGPYSFEVLGFKAGGQTSVFVKRAFQLETDCLTSLNSKASVKKHLVFRMAPRKDILNYLVGDIVLVSLATEKQPVSEMWIRITSELSPLVYSLLPQKMVHGELSQRSKKIFWNFIEHKNKKRRDTNR
jgi:hypothetical protein